MASLDEQITNRDALGPFATYAQTRALFPLERYFWQPADISDPPSAEFDRHAIAQLVRIMESRPLRMVKISEDDMESAIWGLESWWPHEEQRYYANRFCGGYEEILRYVMLRHWFIRLAKAWLAQCDAEGKE